MRLYITILAGGLGKRMRSTIPKVLHKVNNEPMLVRIIKEAKKLKPYKIIIVVGKYYFDILQVLTEYNVVDNISFAYQKEPLGTGDSVKASLNLLYKDSVNLILNGDVPLIQADTLKDIYNNYIISNNRLQITCINLGNPTGCGRIILDDNNNFIKIVEEKDCDQDQKKISLVNCGIYIADSDVLIKYIPMITNNNASNEYYLTDIVDIYKNNTGEMIGLYKLSELQMNEVANINTKEELDRINSKLESYQQK